MFKCAIQKNEKKTFTGMITARSDFGNVTFKVKSKSTQLTTLSIRVGVFAGPRVIKDTTQSELPEGFQTAEFLIERGLIDAIIPRTELKNRLSEYLDYLCGDLD